MSLSIEMENPSILEDLAKKYQAIRQRSIAICAPLNAEDMTVQAIFYASPPKWQLAHTTWFFEEMILKKFFPNYRIFNTEFSFLFNSYYQSIGERTLRSERGNITRPGIEEIYTYREYVDKHLLELIQKGGLSKEGKSLLELGLNHEEQHQELLVTDIKYTLGHNPIFPIYSEESNLVQDHNLEKGFVSISEGVYEIGHNDESFCFDNELGRHKAYIQDCQISKALVTNAEFLEFMNDGGYTNFKYWLDEGWTWVTENKVKSPLYWHKIDGSWHYYTLAGLKKVDPDAILSHVSFYEAIAFANWKGMRLPTEFEWEVVSEKFEWGKRWEWTNSAYLPYPGFQISEGAVGEYNGKFMVNQMVLRGASVATAPGHSRKTYRNFFHPHFQWQYSGIRLAR